MPSLRDLYSTNYSQRERGYGSGYDDPGLRRQLRLESLLGVLAASQDSSGEGGTRALQAAVMGRQREREILEEARMAREREAYRQEQKRREEEERAEREAEKRAREAAAAEKQRLLDQMHGEIKSTYAGDASDAQIAAVARARGDVETMQEIYARTKRREEEATAAARRGEFYDDPEFQAREAFEGQLAKEAQKREIESRLDAAYPKPKTREDRAPQIQWVTQPDGSQKPYYWDPDSPGSFSEVRGEVDRAPKAKDQSGLAWQALRNSVDPLTGEPDVERARKLLAAYDQLTGGGGASGGPEPVDAKLSAALSEIEALDPAAGRGFRAALASGVDRAQLMWDLDEAITEARARRRR